MRAKVTPGSAAEGLAVAAASALSGVISLLSGGSQLPQDPSPPLDALTSTGAQRFNQRYPEGLPSQHCGEGPMPGRQRGLLLLLERARHHDQHPGSGGSGAGADRQLLQGAQ